MIQINLFSSEYQVQCKTGNIIFQMEQYQKENLKQFKITHSADYIQIQSLIPSFKTQILIDKKHSTIVFEKKGKAFVFNTETQVVYCSLILGIFKIKQIFFLMFADQVYQQPTLPPKGYSVYQISSVDFVPFKHTIHKQEQNILETLQKQIFKFGFYFSFDIDLTHRCQTLLAQTQVKPVSRYFWNESLLNNLFESKTFEEWRIPIIQGYYNKFETFIDQSKITYYLISRRSKERSGTRFYSRGIDENGNCSNFIETEQVIIVGKYLMSVVYLSGSSPIFWEQKSQTKPIRLTRNKDLTKGPFLQHMASLNSQYDCIFLLNLLQKKKEGENLLIKAYEQMLSQNMSQLDSFCRYVYFDINESIKKKSYNEIISLVNKVDKIVQHFNCFIYDLTDLKVLSKQSGAFRLSCLDCLNRTNVMMQALAIKTLEIMLEHVGISIASLMEDLLQKSDDQMSALLKNFKLVWLGKADYESLIYSGTRAVSGLKNKFLDEIDSSFVSIQRLYNQKFMDRIKQTSIDLIHYDSKTQLKIKKGHCQYTSPLKVSIVTWNVNATSPEKLKIREIVKHLEGSDVIVFGMQQIVELVANNVMMEQEESKLAGQWEKQILGHLNEQCKNKFIVVQKIEMVGIMLIVFISEGWKNTLKCVHKDTVKTGMGGSFGNKGAAVIRINIFDTSLCFTCAHLAAGESKTKERIDDIEQIHKKAFQQNKSGIQNQLEIQASDHKFFFGDLNFRLIGEFKDFSDLYELAKKEKTPQYKQLESRLIDELVNRDQLVDLKMRSDANYFLSSYMEEEINFLPTYKLEKATGNYTLEKSRNPSWCDRILFWSDDLENHTCSCVLYTSINVTGSDHRPVLGKFVVSILKQEQKTATEISSVFGKEFRDTFLEKDLLS